MGFGMVSIPATLVALLFSCLALCDSNLTSAEITFSHNALTTVQPVEANNQSVTSATETNPNTTETWTNVTGEPSKEAHLSKFSNELFIIVIPIITVVGIAGNTLTFITTQRPTMRPSSVSVYMAALSCADTLVLVFDFINNWVRKLFGVYLTSSSAGFCTFYMYIFNVCYTYSAWLVVSLSCERFIVVHFPLKAKTICTAKKAIITVCVEPLVILFLYAYCLGAWEINEDGRCDLNNKMSEFMSIYSPWISGVAYSYLPVCLLIIFNTAIIYDLSKTQKNRKTMGVEKLETRKVTITVIVICISFVVLTVPLTLFYAILFSAQQFVQKPPAMALGRTIILILGLSNHAINFFLYVLTSQKFRDELKNLLCCVGKHEKSVSFTPTFPNVPDSSLHTSDASLSTSDNCSSHM